MNNLKNRTVMNCMPPMSNASIIGLLVEKLNPEGKQLVITREDLSKDSSITFDYSEDGVLITVF